MKKPFDLVKSTKAYKGELHDFFLDMKAWAKFKTRHELTWQKCRFTEENRKGIPRERGLYVFTLELTPSKLPSHGYILYVGITGDRSDAHLWSRYGQYLSYQRRMKGRPAILVMLKDWDGHLFFNFVALPDTRIDIGKIEASFQKAIVPPINKRDYDAQLSAVRRGAF